MSTDTITALDTSVVRTSPRRHRWAWGRKHPIASLVLVRAAIGVFVLWAVSLLVFFATQVLPGNAASSFLGPSATPDRVAALETKLGLDRPPVEQYLNWIGNLLTGNPGTSLISGRPIIDSAATIIINTAVLILVASVVGILLAVVLGLLAAWHRGSIGDRIGSVAALTTTALPEFVIALGLVMLLAVNVFRVLPAVSSASAGQPAWSDPAGMVLPALTLSILVVPYAFYMVRAAVVEALESDYAELAQLKGLSARRLLLTYALPNALPPIIQVLGLTLLVLAGGTVVVEYVFNYPGLGAALVESISNRDIPMIQFLVLTLSAFYVVVNIVTDVVTLMATPRRRIPR